MECIYNIWCRALHSGGKGVPFGKKAASAPRVRRAPRRLGGAVTRAAPRAYALRVGVILVLEPSEPLGPPWLLRCDAGVHRVCLKRLTTCDAGCKCVGIVELMVKLGVHFVLLFSLFTSTLLDSTFHLLVTWKLPQFPLRWKSLPPLRCLPPWKIVPFPTGWKGGSSTFPVNTWGLSP